jgi:mRNA interferase RelE/StbE
VRGHANGRRRTAGHLGRDLVRRRRLETSVEFDRAARKLDKESLRRIKRYLDEVVELEDPRDRDRGRGLTANLSTYWRYRIGDYRVIVEIRDDRLVVIAIGLGHRSAIYRNR